MLEVEETSIARAPFDNPKGDIIIESADRVHFRVFKLILSLASDVFQSMFTLPQDTMQSDVSSVPIIPVTESSTIFESLLLLCYPSPNPTFKTLEDAKAVPEAAKKYGVEAAISRAGDIIFARFLETKPLELYALSCAFRWKQLAQRAADQTLQINLKDPGRSDSEFTGIKDLSAFYYHRLLLYHHERGIAAQAVGESLTWLTSSISQKSIGAVCMWKCAPSGKLEFNLCKRVRKIQVPGLGDVLITPWFDEYLVSSGRELYARPCKSTIWNRQSTSTYNCAIKKAITCPYCQSVAIGDIEIFRIAYAAQVEKVLANVRLKLNDD